jgi:acyl-CoA synthetase (AMP-forming)/AMP-acid ligase II
MSTLVAAIEDVARRHGGAPALSWHKAAWSYSDLAGAMARVGDALPVNAGDRVALLLRNSPQFAAAFYGVLRAGAVAVPLNVQERAGVLARQIEHCGARVVLVDAAHVEFAALRAALDGKDVVLMPLELVDASNGCEVFCASLGEQEVREAAPLSAASLCPERLSPERLACIIYTSGTTGRPKGVMLSHANLSSNARIIANYLGIVPADKVMCPLPFHFSYGMSVLNSNLASGAQVVLEDNLAFPQLLVKRLQDEGITGFAGVPATFALLLGRTQFAELDLSRLRYVTQAGGAMPRPQIQALRAALPQAHLFIMYGQTEATARLSFLPPDELDEKLGSVGLPLPGVDIEIRDPSGRVVPDGEVGELCARGPNVMMGYWDDAALTAQVVRDGWLHTGDLAHRDGDGYLYIDGREVEMIKVGAFRVSPQEIEEVLATLPGVQEVAVTGMPDALLGQAIKAVIVPREGAATDVMVVKAHCRAHLAQYKIPKIVEFVAELPRTSSGKVQRYKLA